MEDIRTRNLQQLQYFDCYEVSPTTLGDGNNSIDLGIDYSLSLHNIDEKLLASLSKKATNISLTITGVLVLPQSAVGVITKFISPKLRRIVVNDCDYLSWNDIKSILAAADSVEVLDLRRNAWVNDYVVEQLSIKFAKSLKGLHLERSDLTDSSLVHVGRRCLQLRQLTFDCCYKVFIFSYTV